MTFPWICTHTFAHGPTCAYINADPYIYICVYIYIVCIYIYILYMCIYIYCICVYVCAYILTHTCICICIYIYTLYIIDGYWRHRMLCFGSCPTVDPTVVWAFLAMFEHGNSGRKMKPLVNWRCSGLVALGFLVLRASAYMLTFTAIAARNASSVPGGPTQNPQFFGFSSEMGCY